MNAATSVHRLLDILLLPFYLLYVVVYGLISLLAAKALGGMAFLVALSGFILLLPDSDYYHDICMPLIIGGLCGLGCHALARTFKPLIRLSHARPTSLTHRFPPGSVLLFPLRLVQHTLYPLLAALGSRTALAVFGVGLILLMLYLMETYKDGVYPVHILPLLLVGILLVALCRGLAILLRPTRPLFGPRRREKHLPEAYASAATRYTPNTPGTIIRSLPPHLRDLLTGPQ